MRIVEATLDGRIAIGLRDTAEPVFGGQRHVAGNFVFVGECHAAGESCTEQERCDDQILHFNPHRLLSKTPGSFTGIQIVCSS